MSGAETATVQAELIPVEDDLAFTAERDVLLAAVSRIKEALPARTAMPVLTGIHIQARPNGSVRLRANDLERDVETTVLGDVATAGIAVPAGAPLAQLLARAPNGALRCSSDGRQFSLAWSGAKFHLPVFNSDVYPEPPAVEATEAATLPGTLFSALAEAAFAASADTGRPVLQGVRLRPAEGSLVALACDGTRVARATASGVAWTLPETVVPAAGLVLAARALGAAESVRVAAGQGALELSGPETTIRLRLLEGRYPDVEALLPGEYATVIELDRSALTAALERAAVVTGSAAQLHLVRLVVGADGLSCRAEAPEGGSASEDLEASVSGDPLEIGVNGLLLREILRHIGGSRLRIELAGPVAAMRLTGKRGPVCWQMPLRLG